jgi:hypothetical protein
MPIVDVYYAGNAEKTGLEEELASASGIAAQMPTYERRVAEKLAQLTALEDRAVDEDSLPALRGRLLELAKETNCSIRRFNVGAANSRPWLVGDDPLATRIDAAAKNKDGESGTGFVLEWRPVNLSLTGSSADLRALIERITASEKFMHMKSLEMFPASPSRQSLTLEMELWFYTLARKG